MKKASLCFVLFMAFFAGCGPASHEPANPPTVSPLPGVEVTGTAIITRGPTSTSVPAFEPTVEPTFPTLPPPNIREAHIEKIQMMDATSGWAWAVDRAYKSYLLHTADGGLNWKDVTPEQDTPGSFSSFMLDAQTAWMVLKDDGLLWTSDGGKNWEVINQNLKDELVWPFRDWYRLCFTDARHGWLITGLTAAGARELFYKTQDGGVTWKPADFETLPSVFHNADFKNELAFWTTIDVIYYDSERFIVILGEQEGALEMSLSKDWGGSWRTVQLPSSAFSGLTFEIYDRKINAPVFFDRQNGVLTVTTWDRYEDITNLLVYGTSDGGLSWRLTGGPSLIRDDRSGISLLSPRDVVFVCGTNFCVSHDGGNSWQALDFGVPVPIEGEPADFQLDFIDPTTGWLVIGMNDTPGWPLSSRLLKTTDGGATWTELSPTINR